MSYEEKRYLVTGGSRGIGRAIVLALASQGAHVAFTYKNNESAAQEVVAASRDLKGSVVPIHTPVNGLNEARTVVANVRERFGGLDGLITNAGVTRDKLLAMMTEEDWDTVVDTNLKGTFNYCKAVIYGFIQQKQGRIVCISSVGGLSGTVGQTNYSASKAALIGFVRSLSKEAARFHVTVNCVAPGFVETDMWQAMSEKKKLQAIEQIPAGRPATPEEIAGSVLYLLSDAAAYVTGSTLVIDGGLTS
ncbi:3-oxoacyl-ACP reductase FabG [Ammoniphilus sp. CFH 90114]|uniref:3-oxoacyl-ACP reductase FabG n=1 Tax=Ammoniphilus sp. CFH 90114 TaxID=2493665 RepID=UPI00100ECCEE|nr:3-oxoacyl-ACP reductase FabG [Ammoniphilus sp. CFH 90114]RXT13590.1 SDR family oxidoreductase [Ammoniphilus sp. CFH 90114]